MIIDYQVMFGLDKQAHFLSYAFISFFIGVAIILLSDLKYMNQNISFIWFVLVVIGIMEEYRQYLLPNRSAEFLDAVANMLGVTFGVGIPLVVTYLIKDRKRLVIRLLILYCLVLIPLFIGLLFFNERPFLSFHEPFEENIKKLIAAIGF